MKSVTTRVALFTVALAAPALMLAAGQPNHVRMVTKAEMLDHTVFARVINQGKSAVRSTAPDVSPASSKPAPHLAARDSAFTK